MKSKRKKKTFERGLTKRFKSEYSTWQGMHFRCTNPKNHAYHNYGARGISVCPEWGTFDKFMEDMGPRPPGKSLDRINNDGNYSKENCRWATQREQCNNYRPNRIVEYKGKLYTFVQLAEAHNIRPDTLARRLRYGWALDKAIETPVLPVGTMTEAKRAGRARIGTQITFMGRTQNISAWAREFGIRPHIIYGRLAWGWSVEKAITTPKVKESGNYGKREKKAA